MLQFLKNRKHLSPFFAGVARVVLILSICVCPARGDDLQLHLKNGDVLSGTLVTESDGAVDLRHPVLGLIHIPASEILRRVPISPHAGAAAPPPPTSPTPKAASESASKPGSAVTSLAPKPAPKPPARWNFDIQAGVDLGFGTTDRQSYNSRARAVYAKDRLKNVVDASFLFGESQGIKSAERLDASMKTDYDLHGRFFLYNQGGAGYDDIRHINLRYEAGPGFGYHLIKRDSIKMNVELGGNYQVHRFADGNRSESFFYRVAEDAVWRITPKLAIDQRFEFFPGISDMQHFRIRFEGNLRYSLRENLYLNLTALDLYDNFPALGVTKNDIQIRSSIGMKF